jgi:ATP adenylyltransferase
MKFLAAPWRWKFISDLVKTSGCIFCNENQNPDKASLVCYRGKNFFIKLNKYPYTTGHIMIAPLAHLKSPDQLPAEDSTELWSLLNQSLGILKKNFHPDGFNVGMNLGQVAGAGIKDHFHLHIVPRWSGDANFMPVIGGTKVMSYDLSSIFDILYKEFNP